MPSAAGLFRGNCVENCFRGANGRASRPIDRRLATIEGRQPVSRAFNGIFGSADFHAGMHARLELGIDRCVFFHTRSRLGSRRGD